jgi:hypothetical protein
MAVKNLVLGLSEHGKIKAGKKGKMTKSKGGKEFRPPEKLDHYIITTNERDTNGDYIIDEPLMEKLKKNGAITRGETLGEIIGIPGRLLYNDPDLNFSTRYAKYTSGKCVCHGDGVRGNPIGIDKPIKCPCSDLENGSCKINGKLHFVIEGYENLGGCHVLRTTSMNTVRSILGSMELLKAATGGLLAFLPLHLFLSPKTVMVPATGQTVKVYVSSLIFRGTIDDLQTRALEMAKQKAQYLAQMEEIETRARRLIEFIESPEDEEDIQHEFYPEAKENAKVAEAEKTAKADEKKTNAKAGKVEKESRPDHEPEPEPESDKPEPAGSGDAGQPEHDEKQYNPHCVIEDDRPITNEHKKKILLLKNKLKISNPKDWKDLLKSFQVESANQMTTGQAESFISQLEKKAGNDIPY